MRILTLHPGNLQGGVETDLRQFFRSQGLVDLDHRFGFCFDGPFADLMRGEGAPVTVLGPARISRPWTVWWARRRAVALASQTDPAVIMVHSLWAMLVFGSVARKLRLPLVLWQHDCWSGQPILERLARGIRPDLLVANSEYGAGTSATVYPSMTPHILRPCLMAPNPSSKATDRAALRQEFQVSNKQLVITQVGRCAALKGHQTLIAALGKLPNRIPWVCWIVGGPQTRAEQQYYCTLHTMARRAGIEQRIRFLGQRNDVSAILNASDISCQPNDDPETFGLALVEALYAGIPVVCCAIGGSLEIMTPECGILCPPRQPQALADALEQLLESKERRNQLGEKGPERARHLCDPQQQMRQLRGLLNRAGTKSRGP